MLAKTKYWTRELSKTDAQLMDMSLINFPTIKEVERNCQEE
jgi:hypothetical protein